MPVETCACSGHAQSFEDGSRSGYGSSIRYLLTHGVCGLSWTSPGQHTLSPSLQGGHEPCALAMWQVQSWKVGGAGEAVCISQGVDDRSLVTLTTAGMLQWWDSAALKVLTHHTFRSVLVEASLLREVVTRRPDCAPGVHSCGELTAVYHADNLVHTCLWFEWWVH